MNAFVYIGLPEETARAGPLPWMVAEGYRIVPGETVRAFSEASSRTLAFRLFSKFYAAGSRLVQLLFKCEKGPNADSTAMCVCALVPELRWAAPLPACSRAQA